MKKQEHLRLAASAIMGAAFAGATPAMGQTQVSGAIGIATENVGRGISYSSEKPAVYASASFRRDQFEFAGSAITVSGGSATYEAAVAVRYVWNLGDTQVRAQVERTLYPGATPNIDYWEYGLTARREWESGFVQLGLRHSPDDSGGAQYVFLDAGRRLAHFAGGDLSARGRLGWRPYDDNAIAGLPDYHHWSAGVDFSTGPMFFELTYHDTDLPTGTFFPSDARVALKASYRFDYALSGG